MPKAKVQVLNEHKKINPIPREKDNTSDLELAEQRVHARYSHIRAPQGTKDKRATKGSFDPTDNTAFNGNVVTSPHGAASQHTT